MAERCLFLRLRANHHHLAADWRPVAVAVVEPLQTFLLEQPRNRFVVLDGGGTIVVVAVVAAAAAVAMVEAFPRANCDDDCC